ncbi:hypothetical protein [Allosphingosinicella flava]|nr:hypothetical protein [Sphingosinicella flava]
MAATFLAMPALASPAMAGCVGRTNYVQVVNKAMTLTPIGEIPVETHFQWRVADSRSGWLSLPFNQPQSRTYPTNYPLIVDGSVNEAVKWRDTNSVDVMALINEALTDLNEQGQCKGGDFVVDFQTTILFVANGATVGSVIARGMPQVVTIQPATSK